MKKAIGIRGSWFATIDGEKFACVHKHWFKKQVYHDPNARPGEPKWNTFIAALQSKKQAILTESEPWSGEGPFQRKKGNKGYIAVWEIDDVIIIGSDLKFRFVRPLITLL